MYQVLCIIIAIMAFINGIYLIYRFVTMPKRDLRFGEGQTLQKLNEIYKDNQIMKKALKDIAESEVLIGFHPQENTEIDDYQQAITEMSCGIKMIMSRAHMALESVSEEVE